MEGWAQFLTLPNIIAVGIGSILLVAFVFFRDKIFGKGHKQSGTGVQQEEAISKAYTCKCGYKHMDVKQFRKHLFVSSKKDGKGVHKSVGAVAVKEGKYPALIIEKDKPWYFGKIPEPLGHIFVCDTTLPETGDHYLVKKLGDGGYEAYDPRIAPIISTDTPETAYRKTQDWEADIPYVDEMGLMEKLPAIAAYVLLGATVLLLLIHVGK